MTIKTLLTHVEPDWGSGRALAAAVELAKRFDAHLIGLGAEDFEPVDYAYADGSVVQMLRDQIDADALSAEARFRQATASLGKACSWETAVESPVAAMASCARGADLVVARRTRHDSGAGNLCPPASLIVDVGAPVLLVPDTDAPLQARSIVVAWRDGAQARRALSDALPFLTAAETVRLVEVCGPSERAERERDMALVCARLSRLGVKASAQAVSHAGPSVAAEIERAAEAIGADLIVTGAYSHRRLQEWVLGGVTQDLMNGSGRYVLFSH
jgi:nucleotide-binding universal stress UspA family protein